MKKKEQTVKAPIQNAVSKVGECLEPPAEGARRYPLAAGEVRFKADFAYRLQGGWLFIEDGGSPVKKLTRYWHWLAHQEQAPEVHVLHLVTKGFEQRRLAAFLAEQAQRDLPHFSYRQLQVTDWKRQEEWGPALEAALRELCVSGERH